MRLIIAGSRSISDDTIIETALEESPFSIDDITKLIHGDAEGVDTLASEFFQDIDEVDIDPYPYEEFIEDASHPKVAPLLRNTKMAEEADALIAIWDGDSTGTEDMIQKAKENDLEVYIHRTDTTTFSDFA